MSLDFINKISNEEIRLHFDHIVYPSFEMDYHVELWQDEEEYNHQIVFRKNNGENITDDEVKDIKIRISKIYGSRAPFYCVSSPRESYMRRVILNMEYYLLFPIESLPKDLKRPSDDVLQMYEELLELGVSIKFRESHQDYLFIHQDRFVSFCHVNGAENKEIALIRRYLRL